MIDVNFIESDDISVASMMQDVLIRNDSCGSWNIGGVEHIFHLLPKGLGSQAPKTSFFQTSFFSNLKIIYWYKPYFAMMTARAGIATMGMCMTNNPEYIFICVLETRCSKPK
jgi:hypothetical protein